MTMGFRNRPQPSRATYDGSPTTGRIVVGAVCAGTIALGLKIIPPLLWLTPLALAGMYAAAFKPDLFD